MCSLDHSPSPHPFFIKPDLTPSARKVESFLLQEKRKLIDSGVDRRSIKIRGFNIYVNGQLLVQLVTQLLSCQPLTLRLMTNCYNLTLLQQLCLRILLLTLLPPIDYVEYASGMLVVWLISFIFYTLLSIDREILPTSFVSYHHDRSSRGGGVLLAVHHSRPSCLLSSPTELEIVSVEIIVLKSISSLRCVPSSMSFPSFFF